MSDSPNFLTYAQTAFDSFDERPFCAVDSLVFAWLSYLRLPQDMSELEGWQGLDVRELLRAKEAAYQALDLGNPRHSDADVLEAVANHPELLNRPIVVTPRGARLCRPPEMVLELLSTA